MLIHFRLKELKWLYFYKKFYSFSYQMGHDVKVIDTSVLADHKELVNFEYKHSNFDEPRKYIMKTFHIPFNTFNRYRDEPLNYQLD